uniref:C2H2-type domain-containing protein n=1 Tax=Oryza glumipatula TaxID=40148 RepID=A0A0D9YMC7_9ORYZ
MRAHELERKRGGEVVRFSLEDTLGSIRPASWKFSMGSGMVKKKVVKAGSFDLDVKLDKSWMEDITCPICLDFPHNAVLLRCTSYEKGCRPFICDTDQSRSNCLERFKGAHGLPTNMKVPSFNGAPLDSIHIISSNTTDRPACPLCRGDVIGWVVIDEARLHLNQKKRCCEESCCSYVGNFHELQKHTQQKHPNSRPSEIDPARRVDWENFQQSSDIIDVLSTIHAQVPNGIVLGDYVIEYGDDDAGDDYEVYHRVRGNWWTSCIFCKSFCRSSGGRSRARARERRSSGRRSSNRSSQESFTIEVPSGSVDIREIRFDEIDDEYIVTGAMPGIAASRRIASHYRDPRYGRRRSYY